MKKRYFLYVALPVLAVLALGGTAYADSTASGRGAYMDQLVNAIATRFNLNTSDVQQVFDEQKTQMQEQMQQNMQERQAEMEQNFKDRINQAVTDGKLTQDQADKILAKKSELIAFREGLQGKTKDEIASAIKAEADSLKQWLQDNNIPEGYLGFGRFGVGREFGFMGMRGGHWHGNESN